MNRCISEISDIGILPSVHLDDAAHAVPLAQALHTSYIDALLLTGENACAGIRAVRDAMDDILIGAGNIVGLEQAQQAVQAGAQWIVTPGLQETVVRWCMEQQITVVPGVSSASEIEQAIACGLDCVHLFPAQAAGGVQTLQAYAKAYPQMHFLVSDGMGVQDMHAYLSQPNVLAVIREDILSTDTLERADWAQAEQKAESAVKQLLGFELIHVGVNQESCEQALETAQTLCTLFHFTYYKKPKSHFAGRGFEILNTVGRGRNGHIGIYTPYPEKAMRYLGKKGVRFVEDSITRNKKTNAINFVYLDLEIAGFGVHLINPDVKMKT